MGDFKRVTSLLYSSKHPQREMWQSWWHVKLIWASDGGLWGDRQLMCHKKRAIGQEECQNLVWEILKCSLTPLYSVEHPPREIWLSWEHAELIWATDGQKKL